MNIRKVLCLVLAAASLFCFSFCAPVNTGESTEPTDKPSRDSSKQSESPEVLTVSALKINRHGTVLLDTDFERLKEAGIEIGDIITVFVGQTSYDMPVGSAYTDVDSGAMICRFDLEDREVGLAINMGSFAEVTGAAVKTETAEDPGYRWEMNVSSFGLLLKEKGGYLEEYTLRSLTRTDARKDYQHLTDEEFANFRAVAVSGMKEGVLYRSTTPVDPAIGRNEFAMAAMEKAGIRTVINLDDSAEEMKNYETFRDSYYAGCAIFNAEMGYDFTSDGFAEKVRQCLLFLVENDAPVLIHCKEGKDRTGILCAIIECFVGAQAHEIDDDYMRTYQNFYGIEKGDAAYGVILEKNLHKVMRELFGIDDLESADLQKEAQEYLLSAGLSREELAALSLKLAVSKEG